MEAENDKALTGKENSQSYAQRRRAEKKEALRDFLSGQKYIEAINNDLSRDDITSEELPVIKFKTETRLKLLAKVLPDVKAVELTGENGGPVRVFASDTDEAL